MADPFTIGAMAAVSIGTSIVGAAIGAKGAEEKGQAQAQQFGFQAAIADRNKLINLQNADYARSVGEADAQKSGLKTEDIIARQKIGQAAGNLDVNFGSAAQVRDSTMALGWHDQQVIRSDAARRAYGFEQQAEQAGTQAQMYRAGGADALRAGDIGAATSILGGISSVSSKWISGTSSGTFGSTSQIPSKAFMNNEWGW